MKGPMKGMERPGKEKPPRVLSGAMGGSVVFHTSSVIEKCLVGGVRGEKKFQNQKCLILQVKIYPCIDLFAGDEA